MASDIHIESYRNILARSDERERAQLHRALDDIFFDCSNTTAFASTPARDAFRERWLGRYLVHDPQWTYLAIAGGEGVVGYVAGSRDDPAQTPRFSDIGYFERFAALTALYPAHLHININASHRSRGVGRQLIAQFCDGVAAAGSPGVHVVTSRGARNVGFYNRNGFHEVGSDGEGNKEIVLLAKRLG